MSEAGVGVKAEIYSRNITALSDQCSDLLRRNGELVAIINAPRKLTLPAGLDAFAPHVETEYANGWNKFRERLIIALKDAGIEVES